MWAYSECVLSCCGVLSYGGVLSNLYFSLLLGYILWCGFILFVFKPFVRFYLICVLVFVGYYAVVGFYLICV